MSPAPPDQPRKKRRSGFKLLVILIGLGAAGGVLAFTMVQPQIDGGDTQCPDDPDWLNDDALDAYLERAQRLSAELEDAGLMAEQMAEQMPTPEDSQ